MKRIVISAVRDTPSTGYGFHVVCEPYPGQPDTYEISEASAHRLWREFMEGYDPVIETDNLPNV